MDEQVSEQEALGAIRWTTESCPGSVDGWNDSFEFGGKPYAAPKRPPTLSLGRSLYMLMGLFPSLPCQNTQTQTQIPCMRTPYRDMSRFLTCLILNPETQSLVRDGGLSEDRSMEGMIVRALQLSTINALFSSPCLV